MIKDTINIMTIRNGLRFNPTYHLSEANFMEKKIHKFEVRTLKDLSIDIFTAGRSKRMYSLNGQGIPFLGNVDILSTNPKSNCNYVSSKYWKENRGFLKEGMVLTGRVGQNTVGAFTYATKDHEGCVGSDNVIRIINNQIVTTGYLYSYLASKYGYTFSRKHISGNAQPFVTEEMLGSIPVPIFPPDKQQQIHDLITQSAELRVEANRLLEEAHKKLDDCLKINLEITPKQKSISSTIITRSHTTRFEASYYLTKGFALQEEIIRNNGFIRLNEATSQIFRPGIFKRVYVDKGITFLGGSDIVKAIPTSEKHLSRTRTQGMSELMLKKHWILVTCGGTIGNMAYVDSEMEKCAASQHILRLVPSKVRSGYLYAYLSSDIGQSIITSYTYGSVIPQIEPHHISLVPVPLIDDEQEIQIHNLVMKYVDNNELSKIKESQAIQLVEIEIDQWQN